MSRAPRVTVLRPVAAILPPVIALLLAAVYTQFQSGRAEAAAQALCGRFGPGAAIGTFVPDARAADFEVRGEGAGSHTIIAARTVYRLKTAEYRCTIQHDGTRVTAAATSIVELE